MEHIIAHDEETLRKLQSESAHTPINAHTLRGMQHAASSLVERLRRRVTQERSSQLEQNTHHGKHNDNAVVSQSSSPKPNGGKSLRDAHASKKIKLADDMFSSDAEEGSPSDPRTDENGAEISSNSDVSFERLHPKQTINAHTVSWMTKGGRWSAASTCALPELPVLRKALCTRRQVSDGVCEQVKLMLSR
jgi:hypothetical protein